MKTNSALCNGKLGVVKSLGVTKIGGTGAPEVKLHLEADSGGWSCTWLLIDDHSVVQGQGPVKYLSLVKGQGKVKCLGIVHGHGKVNTIDVVKCQGKVNGHDEGGQGSILEGPLTHFSESQILIGL